MSRMSDVSILLDEARRFGADTGNDVLARKIIRELVELVETPTATTSLVADTYVTGDQSEPQLVRQVRETGALVKEIHENVVAIRWPGTPAPGVDGELPGMDVREDDDDPADFGDTPVPPTEYGVRITYADETEDDIDNIESIQVYHKATRTFPFGFMKVGANQIDEKGDGSHIDYRAGFWRAEDGVFVPFDERDVPLPGGGW